MNLLSILLFITVMVLYTEAAGCPTKCPGCETRNIGEYWKGRDTTVCADVTCKKEGQYRYSWSSRLCPTYDLQPGCVLTPSNLNLGYPNCCPKPNCPKRCPEKCPGCENRSIGETWLGRSTNGCFKITCKKVAEDRYSWSGTGCQTYSNIPSNCRIIYGNPNAVHPGCCDRLSCS